MSRHVFYSLHYAADRSRAELVRKLAVLSPNLEAKPAEWATLQRKGEFAIKHWFEQQLRGRSCTVVLIGAETATRPLVRYEIKRSWELKLGLVGVHIHNLRDANGAVAAKGPSPFPEAGLGELAALVQTFDPPEADSKLAYRYIADNLPKWVEHAVAERAKHG
ncbi:MAG: hypothetical protein JWN04_2253 [Myxococcaceae bacterium]|nr:hypothetical protein [Myxococcaceae bacterium]